MKNFIFLLMIFLASCGSDTKTEYIYIEKQEPKPECYELLDCSTTSCSYYTEDLNYFTHFEFNKSNDGYVIRKHNKSLNIYKADTGFFEYGCNEIIFDRISNSPEYCPNITDTLTGILTDEDNIVKLDGVVFNKTNKTWNETIVEKSFSGIGGCF